MKVAPKKQVDEWLYNTAIALRNNRAKDRILQTRLMAVLELVPNKDLALRIGVSPGFLCDVRHGKRGVSDSLIDKLVEAGNDAAR